MIAFTTIAFFILDTAENDSQVKTPLCGVSKWSRLKFALEKKSFKVKKEFLYCFLIQHFYVQPLHSCLCLLRQIMAGKYL